MVKSAINASAMSLSHVAHVARSAMLKRLAVLAVALACLTTLASAASAAKPGSCSGDCWAHDPAVVKRKDGKYFMFNTGGGIGVGTSSSLAGPWSHKGDALAGGSSIAVSRNSGSDLWAPMVLLVGSTYYMYYSVSTFGSQHSSIGYATSPTMEVGSWTDHGPTGVASDSSKTYNAIDPTVFADASGKYHMTFGSFYADIHVVPMTSPPTKSAGGPKPVVYDPSGDHAVEGSFMYSKGSYYYLFFSAGACCGYDEDKPAAGTEYSIRVCRSDKATGPFQDKNGRSCADGGGTTVMASHDYVYGPGGQGILEDTAHGGSVIYYHYADTNKGLSDADYQFGWNALSWKGGWPVAS